MKVFRVVVDRGAKGRIGNQGNNKRLYRTSYSEDRAGN
jgi:hypothetical protein